MNFFESKNYQEYQSAVLSAGNFQQDWQWGIFQETLGKKVHRFLAEENGVFIFAGQALENQVRGKKYLYFPGGPVLGKSRADKEVLDLLRNFLEELKNPELVFARVEPRFYNSQIKIKKFVKSIDLNPHKTLVLNLNSEVDDIASGMKQKTRYNIKVAEKRGVQIKINENIDKCADLVVATAKRAGIRSFEKDYYVKLFEFFNSSKERGNIKVRFYSAWHEDDMLAANLMLYYENTAFYLFGGSADVKRTFMAPYLLHWRAVLDAKNEGYMRYDFWGIEEDPNHPWYGFSRFKLGFGGDIVSYSGTYDYVFMPTWYNLYKGLRKLNRIFR